MIVHGLFETILVRDGAPVLLDEHLGRLADSARALGLPGLPALPGLRRRCVEAAAVARLPLGRMRVALELGLMRVEVEPFAGYPAEVYRDGAEVLLAGEHPLGEAAGHKVLPYDPLLLAREDARRRGAFEVVFRDGDGALLEGSASNLFLVLGKELRTPPLARGVLPGVTRARVLEVSPWPSREADLYTGDLEGAEEAFLTGSLMEVVPVRRLGGVEIPLGPRADELLAAIRA
jgi:branched-chain amino acid aminotransferase